MPRMIRHAALATGACILLLSAASCGWHPGATAAASRHRPVTRGLTFTIRMAGTSFSGRPSTDSISTQLLDGVVRVEFPSATDPIGAHGATRDFYLLVNTTAKTSTVVMPRIRQYWETRFDSSAARQTKSKSVISDIDVSGRAVGNGGTINGYPTTRYRIDTRYAETTSVPRKRDERKTVHLVEDVWVPDALTDVADPMEVYLRLFPGTAGELVEKQVAVRRKLFKGLPIRTTWLLTQTFDGSVGASRTLTIDLVDLKRAELDAAAFRVPDGYSRIDLVARMNAGFDLLLKGGKNGTTESLKGRRTP